MIAPHTDVSGLEWRAARLSDVDGILDLQSACVDVDGGVREVASEIRERFESPMIGSIDADTLVGVQEGEIVVSLWCHILPQGSEAWKVYDDNYIRPDHRTDEVVNFALDWWEGRAIERLEEADDDLPVRYHQHVYPTQSELTAVIESRGFTPAIYFDELRRDLSEPIPDLSVPDGLRLVNHAVVPIEDALELRNHAFADHRGSQAFTLEMWKSRANEFSCPDASFAILDDDRPVSYLLSGVYPQDAEEKGYTEGFIEGVGTARSHRGLGLARILICEAMKAFAASGLEFATLEVDTENPTGATGLYANLGFERVNGFIEYTKTVDRKVKANG
jgi:ribosomal protein S18 acetylase RimI-like enzyme